MGMMLYSRAHILTFNFKLVVKSSLYYQQVKSHDLNTYFLILKESENKCLIYAKCFPPNF